jgi:methenyltetrahydromethanopterin cyclohydrolase
VQQAVLIVAQSGRFLAELAYRAGYSVWVAECYGDQDTLDVAERWRPISDINDNNAILKTIIELSQSEPCILIYGSGVETFFPVLDLLPATITVIGNTNDTIELIKTPYRFFSLLKQLSIPYPETHSSSDGDKPGRWLCKPPRGFGGQSISEFNQKIDIKDHYYQRHIDGLSGSVLFLARYPSTHIISFNQQFQHLNPNNAFLYSGSSTPLDLSVAMQQKIKMFINMLVAHTNLCGFNSLDFIISTEGQIYVLEINPRISAAVELINNELAIFEHHYAACTERPDLGSIASPSRRHLHLFFAPVDIIVPKSIDWPEHYHDLPKADTLIKASEPICSAVIDNSLSFEASEKAIQQSLYALLALPEKTLINTDKKV